MRGFILGRVHKYPIQRAFLRGLCDGVILGLIFRGNRFQGIEPETTIEIELL